MAARSRSLKGIWTAVLSFLLLYAVYLGFAAVTILIVALDSHGPVDPVATGQFGLIILFVSQGIGVSFSGVLIGVPALLPMIFDVAVVASLARRHGPKPGALVLGTVTWAIINLLLAWRGGLSIHENLFSAILRAAVVFAVGYALSAVPAAWRALDTRLEASGSTGVRLVLHQSLTATRRILMAYGIESLVVVVLWAILNHEAMGKVFDMIHMPGGSRFITTLLTLFWLPNICMWALSWALGSGFAIGTLGSFTLWTGTAHDLPPVPIFGIFPQAVSADWLRYALLLLPVLIGFVIGFLQLATKRNFNYFNLSISPSPKKHLNTLAKRIRGKGSETRATDQPSTQEETNGDDDDAQLQRRSDIVRLIVVKAAYPLAAFCITGVALVFVSAIANALANGSLGTGHLAHIGVDVAASTQALARPTFSGLLISWVVAVVCLAVLYALRWRKKAAHEHEVSLSEDDLVPLDEINTDKDKSGTQGERDSQKTNKR